MVCDIYICVCVYVCVCLYVYLGFISSLVQISLNNIDILYLHIFLYIFSSHQIGFIVLEGNWLVKLP